MLDLWKTNSEVTKAESKEKGVDAAQAPGSSREVGATSRSVPDPEVKSPFSEGKEEGDPTPRQSSALTSFRGFRPMSTHPGISLENPRVEVEGTPE